jgi:3'-5' exonuclease
MPNTDKGDRSAFLVVDTESVPDGRLISMVKYPGEGLTPEKAIERAQAEAREKSRDGSDFLPASFQYPVAICVVRVSFDYSLQKVTCLDAPQYRPREMVQDFWSGLAKSRLPLVTFNGRGFDLPLLELAAFRYGCTAREYFLYDRGRFGTHFDLLAWLNNFGAIRHSGGLHLLSKILGKPGKMEVSGDQVYSMWRAGKLQEINDYCMFDTLDTYFAFLRTLVLKGDLNLEREQKLVDRAKEFLTERTAELPALKEYLANWGDWQPWP